MDPRRTGCRRDRQIVLAVEQAGVLDAEQVHRLLFGHAQQGLRIAQRRLQRLVAAKALRRRWTPDRRYCYSVGRFPSHLEHRLLASWAYVWLRRYGEISWRSIDLGGLRPDAFAECAGRQWFVEADVAESGNAWNKAQHYDAYYQAGQYGDWAVRATRFPAILVVTTGWRRKEQIQERIEQENTSGLEWIVKHADTIKEECARVAERSSRETADQKGEAAGNPPARAETRLHTRRPAPARTNAYT